jgi:hypothetical protein
LSKLKTISILLLVAVLIAVPCSAQVPNLNPGKEGNTVPVVMFEFSWGNVKPSHFAIAVESTGKAAYRSDELKPDAQGDTDAYFTKFVITEPTRDKIFELAKQANFFKGDFDYTKTRIAQTGIKTLTYLEGHLPNDFEHPTQGQENKTTYNWSENPAIQELTKIFESISSTIELGRTLDFDRRFEKLGLDDVLKNAEEMQKAGDLTQLQLIAPALRNVVNDTSVMNIARERAQRLLAIAESGK